VRESGVTASALAVRMVASEILVCGLKRASLVGTAVEVLDSIRPNHDLVAQEHRLAEIEAQLTRWERPHRDLVAKEVKTILHRLRQRILRGPVNTEELRNLRHVQEQIET
jgi:hypothetical protein